MSIDKYAIISNKAQLDSEVSVGAYSIIGDNVEIDSGTVIGSHAVINGNTTIGKNNKIFQFTSIGEDPQDQKYKGEKSYLKIGDNNIIREFCTINRGTGGSSGITHIGDNNLLMNNVHVAHDCTIRNEAVLSNYSGLAGHVIIDSCAVLAGFVGIYQFCHVGRYSFITAGSLVTKDVLPYTKVSGKKGYAKPFGLNSVGLRRHNFSHEKIRLLKRAYNIIYRQSTTVTEAIAELETMINECKEIEFFIAMLKTAMHGIVR